MTKQENNFEKLTLTEVNIFKKILQNIDLNYWIKMCYDFKSKFPSVNRSNEGGYQSPSDINLNPNFYGLVTLINSHTSSIFPNNPNQYINSMWMNISSYGHFNNMHNHDNKMGFYTSGVLYLKIPSSCGNIRFYNPQDLNTNIEVVPSEGGLILFPSYLFHSVDSNLNQKEDRISIAFNYNS